MDSQRRVTERRSKTRRRKARTRAMHAESLEPRQVLAGFPLPLAVHAPLAENSPLDAILGAIDAAARHGVDPSILNRVLLGADSENAQTEGGLPALGGEFQVNAPSHGRQISFTDSAAAGNAAGQSVVVYSGTGNGDSLGVYARLYDADGAPLGAPFLVNTTSRGSQTSPAVATSDSGAFVVVWSGKGPGDREGIFARWYSPSGAALTGEVLVNSSVAGFQHSPAVAMAADGTTAIAYAGPGAGDGEGVYVRKFSAAGAPLGVEQRANATVRGEQSQPDVAINSAGEMIVAWTSRHQGGFDLGVFAQRFAASGEKEGGEFQVASSSRGSQYQPTVGLADSGLAAFAWTHWSSSSDLEEVHARIFGESGDTGAFTPIGPEFEVNDGSTGWQRAPSLAMERDGDFTIGWSSGQFDGAGWEVFARQFDADGEAIAPEFQVNRESSGYASGSQSRVSTALVGDGDLLFVWAGRGAGDRRGVYGQRLDGESDGVNDAPNLAPIADQEIDEGQTLTFTAAATDPNGDDLTFLLDDSAPAGAAIDPVTGVFTWTPTEEQGPGEYEITVLVTDNGSPPLVDSETFIVTVREVNLAPDLAPIDDRTIEEGETVTFTAAAVDPDLPANTLTYSLDDNAPEGAAIDPATGEFTWTPSAAQSPGVYEITVIVTDDGSPPLADSETFTITVLETNLPPDLAPIENRSVEEGQTLTFTASATDPNGDSLTYFLDDSAPEGAAIDPETGEFTFTPTAAQAPGVYEITILVTDDGSPALVDSETFTVTVTELNLPPNLAPIGDRTVEEGQTLSLTATATDPNGDALTYILDDGAPEGAAIDPETGEFTFTPTAEQAPGEYEITVLVTDDGSPALVDSETFTVTVTEINSPPNLTPIDDAEIAQGETLTFTAEASDPDLPSQTLTYTLDDGAPEGAGIDAASGAFTWQVPGDQTPGEYEITVLVTDNGSPALGDSETFVVTVTAAPSNLDLASVPASANAAEQPSAAARAEQIDESPAAARTVPVSTPAASRDASAAETPAKRVAFARSLLQSLLAAFQR